MAASRNTSSTRRSATSGMHSSSAIADEEFEVFQSLIYQEAGIHLNDNKRVLVASRLSKRLRALNIDSYLDYLEYVLVRDPDGTEMQEMINCITTNKTEFFREPHHFHYLTESCFPALVDSVRQGRRRRLRAWSSACSMGHEAYTLAIAVSEFFQQHAGWDIRILASDIDTNVLKIAEQGIYSLAEIGSMPRHLQTRHFLRGKGKWNGSAQAKAELRNLITFRQINLVKPNWPIRTRFDFIFCRNLLIYFDQPTQQGVLRRLAEYLEPGGLLFIGHSENMTWSGELFEPLGGTIYRLRDRA